MHKNFIQQIKCSIFNTGTSRFHANRCIMIGWGPCEKAAVCQLSCNMSAQLNCTLPTQLSAHVQFVSSAATVNSAVSSGGTGQLSCHLLVVQSLCQASWGRQEVWRAGWHCPLYQPCKAGALQRKSVFCIIVIVKYRETGDCTKPRTLDIPEYRESRDHSRYYRVFGDNTSCAPGSVLRYIDSRGLSLCKPGFVHDSNNSTQCINSDTGKPGSVSRLSCCAKFTPEVTLCQACVAFYLQSCGLYSLQPLITQCMLSQCIARHTHALPALYMRHVLPDIQLFDIPQVVTFLVETILSLHVEGFQPTSFVRRKQVGYSFWI